MFEGGSARWFTLFMTPFLGRDLIMVEKAQSRSRSANPRRSVACPAIGMLAGAAVAWAGLYALNAWAWDAFFATLGLARRRWTCRRGGALLPL